MCRISVKYQYTIQAVCAYAYDFQKIPGCALNEACALIRTNTVIEVDKNECTWVLYVKDY